jgi:ribosomal protein S2
MPYVTDRWLGGMLTNWRTIRQRINEWNGSNACGTAAILSALPRKKL